MSPDTRTIENDNRANAIRSRTIESHTQEIDIDTQEIGIDSRESASLTRFQAFDRFSALQPHHSTLSAAPSSVLKLMVKWNPG